MGGFFIPLLLDENKSGRVDGARDARRDHFITLLLAVVVEREKA